MRLWWALLGILLLPCALGATITGSVYDLELSEVRNAVVRITTQPEQRMVAKEGTYAFTVPSGNYVLSARADIDGEEWVAEENLTVSAEGEYTLDLILLPSFAEVDELGGDGSDEAELPGILPERRGKGAMLWGSILLGAGAIAACAVLIMRRRGEGGAQPMVAGGDAPPPQGHDDEFAAAVLTALRKHGGRATQRDLRKEVTFSEAKVSLVLTELEAQGRVRRIRKGRGNIVVLK